MIDYQKFKNIFFNLDQKFIQLISDESSRQGESIRARLNFYKEEGKILLGFSNQGGIQAGHIKLSEIILIYKDSLKLLPAFSAIYFCPDFMGRYCWKISVDSEMKFDRYVDAISESFRIPYIGMYLLAKKDFDLDSSASIFVGDRSEDQFFALRSNISFIWRDLWMDSFR